MPHGLFITGTDADVGKTLIGCALAFAAHARGMRVGVMKPIATGCREVAGILESPILEPKDARGLAYAAACDLPMELICPYRYRSPLAPAAAAEADNRAPPDILEIAEAYRTIAARSDFVIVEGVGGIATPIAWSTAHSRAKDSIDLARALNLDIVIVAANRPGCLNLSLLTIHHAQSRGVGIVGMILNDVDATASPAAETNQESLRKMTGVATLGRVRFKQPVTREIIDALLP
jgi:dethiobiotin synthetase